MTSSNEMKAPIRARWSRHSLGAAIALTAIVAAACGSSASSDKAAGDEGRTSPASVTADANSPAAMPLPSSATAMTIAITAPVSGAVIAANTVTLRVATTGFELRADLAGKSNQDGAGHYHVLLDKSLINMFATPEATISLLNVKPGRHTLTAVPALNDHQEVVQNASTVTIDHQPAARLAPVGDASFTAAPTISIVSPKSGDVVSGAFDIVVAVTNFNLSNDLMGKPALVGYGHWHVNLDTTTGPMMGMASMLGMSGTTAFHASTAGLRAGEHHTLIALLTDNGHAPLTPMVADHVDVTVGS